MRTHTPIDLTRLRSDLLAFYDRDRRDLPWRRESDPYRIWVSEVMLQQTRVETAEPYYRRWMERFPTLGDLADAPRDDVLKAWEGLGYYSRARRLHDGARLVRERMGGDIPSTAHALRQLPGVGEYTAGAIASIAFREVTPAIDGNARRVLARLLDAPDPGLDELRASVQSLIDHDRPGDFNQAVMELGATICTPRTPKCGQCPVRSHCAASAAGTQLERPVAKSRAKIPVREFGVAVLVDPDQRLLLRRRPDDGLLGGLWELPGVLMESGEPSARAAHRAATETAARLAEAPGRPAPRALKSVRHTFSHFKAIYHAHAFSADRCSVPDGFVWTTRSEALGLAMPVAQRKILEIWSLATQEILLA